MVTAVMIGPYSPGDTATIEAAIVANFSGSLPFVSWVSEKQVWFMEVEAGS